MKHNWELIALSKLVKDYDKELMLELSPMVFTGQNKNIFTLIQKSFLESGRIPSLAALEASVTSKAPKDLLPILTGLLTSITRTSHSDISKDEIVTGLSDTQLISVIDSKFKSLAQKVSTKDVKAVREQLNEMMSEISGNHVKPLDLEDAINLPDNTRIISSGIDALDEHLAGFSGLTLIAAKSGAGKSLYMLQSAIQQYLSGINVLFISLELSAKVIGQRIAAHLTGISFGKIVKDTITAEERKTIAKAMKEFFAHDAEFKIYTNHLTGIELKNVIVAQRAIYGIDITYVDYLNLVDTTEQGQAAWLGLQNLARDLHRISMQHSMVIVSATQITVERGSKNGNPPTIVTRGSSELFFSATLVMFFEPIEGEDEGVYLWVLKNRNGATNCHLLAKDFSAMRMDYTMILD